MALTSWQNTGGWRDALYMHIVPRLSTAFSVPKGLTAGVGRMGEGDPWCLRPSSPFKQIPTCYSQELTSSFVVWLELIRYVWKPERPMMDQTEKKHITASSTVGKSRRPTEGSWGFSWLPERLNVRWRAETPQAGSRLIYSLMLSCSLTRPLTPSAQGHIHTFRHLPSQRRATFTVLLGSLGITYFFRWTVSPLDQFPIWPSPSLTCNATEDGWKLAVPQTLDERIKY